MKLASFKFSAIQRKRLAEKFRLLPDELVQSFLNRCEFDITEWQKEWPTGRRLGNKDSDHLRALSKSILDVRCEIEKLPDGASCALWARWQSAHRKEITEWRFALVDSDGEMSTQWAFIGGQPGKTMQSALWAAKHAYSYQLLELEQLASELADDMSKAGGVVKYCERDLVDRLVQAFLDSSFNRKPSAAPEGMFMIFLGELTKILLLPGGGELTLGKQLVADSIKWHLERESQFVKWESGMYELPQSKQGS